MYKTRRHEALKDSDNWLPIIYDMYLRMPSRGREENIKRLASKSHFMENPSLHAIDPHHVMEQAFQFSMHPMETLCNAA